MFYLLYVEVEQWINVGNKSRTILCSLGKDVEEAAHACDSYANKTRIMPHVHVLGHVCFSDGVVCFGQCIGLCVSGTDQ